MALTIHLPSDLERRLAEEAGRLGQEPEEYVRALVEERLAASAVAERTLLPGYVPRRTAADLLALARARGTAPAERPEDLLGEADADGETPFDVDAFLEARAEWQRCGGPGFPCDTGEGNTDPGTAP